MGVVRNTVHIPGQTPARASVAVDLIRGPAFAGAVEILGHDIIRADEQGDWQINLTSNDEILPAGTTYRVTETVPGSSRQSVFYLVVPPGPGPFDLVDLQVDPPGDLPSPQLTLHAHDETLHGGGQRLFTAFKSDGLFATSSTAPVPVTGWQASMTVPDRPFDIEAVTSLFTEDLPTFIPGHLAIYARIPVLASARAGNVVTLTLPSGHGLQPGAVPIVDLADATFDLPTDVGVPGNAITAATATTVQYNQTAGDDPDGGTGTIAIRISVTASVRGIGQAVSKAVMPNLLWAPSAGLQVAVQPYIRTDNATSDVTVNSANLGAFGNGPNYAVMYGIAR